jgi:hypothetical protein
MLAKKHIISLFMLCDVSPEKKQGTRQGARVEGKRKIKKNRRRRRADGGWGANRWKKFLSGNQLLTKNFSHPTY